MNLCIVLPMWRPCGRESGEWRSPHAARPHGRLRAVKQGFPLRALPLCGVDVSGRRHPLHPFNVVATSVSFSPQNLMKSERLRSSQCAERTTLRNRGQAHGVRAACGESPPPDSRPQGRHIGKPLDFSRVRDSAFCL